MTGLSNAAQSRLNRGRVIHRIVELLVEHREHTLSRDDVIARCSLPGFPLSKQWVTEHWKLVQNDMWTRYGLIAVRPLACIRYRVVASANMNLIWLMQEERHKHVVTRVANDVFGGALTAVMQSGGPYAVVAGRRLLAYQTMAAMDDIQAMTAADVRAARREAVLQFRAMPPAHLDLV